MPHRVTVHDHPLLQESLARLRDKRTKPEDFRKYMEFAGVFLGMRALEDMKTVSGCVKTPLRTVKVRRVRQPIVFAVILRAGLGMLPGLSRLIPDAQIGHIGLYRNEETLNPVRYYVRLPKGLSKSFVVLLDPMLATGGSAAESIHILKTDGAKQICLVTVLSTKAGIRRVHKDHPDTRIVTAAVDPVLNDDGYIVPGLGDAGDRLFNT